MYLQENRNTVNWISDLRGSEIMAGHLKARLSTDLGDPKWIKLLKMEAQETDSSIKDVLVRALESYFSNRLETKALQKASESVFAEWDNPKDSEYDRL